MDDKKDKLDENQIDLEDYINQLKKKDNKMNYTVYDEAETPCPEIKKIKSKPHSKVEKTNPENLNKSEKLKNLRFGKMKSAKVVRHESEEEPTDEQEQF